MASVKFLNTITERPSGEPQSAAGPSKHKAG
jgi:hypothetical protein